METSLMNPILLAYIGDSVLEIFIRQHIILDLKVVKPQFLQKTSIQYVSANAQESFVNYALKEDIFTQEELNFYKRGKNARDTRILKNASPQAHRKSTGFEAVLGHLHLCQNETRLNELLNIYVNFIEQNRDKFETK